MLAIEVLCRRRQSYRAKMTLLATANSSVSFLTMSRKLKMSQQGSDGIISANGDNRIDQKWTMTSNRQEHIWTGVYGQ